MCQSRPGARLETRATTGLNRKLLALKSLIIRVSIGHSVLNAASRFDGVVSEDVPA